MKPDVQLTKQALRYDDPEVQANEDFGCRRVFGPSQMSRSNISSNAVSRLATVP